MYNMSPPERKIHINMQRKRQAGVHAHIKIVYLMEDFYILMYVFPVILKFFKWTHNIPKTVFKGVLKK